MIESTGTLVRLLLMLAATILFNARTLSGTPEEVSSHRYFLSAEDSVFQVGEELTYNVSYAGIDIGQVRISITERTPDSAGYSYTAIAHIDSYKGIPFVDLHTVYQSHIGEPCHSRWFFSRTKDNDRWMTDTYTFDYGRHVVSLAQGVWKQDISTNRDSLRIDALFQDGLSLFFYARKNVMVKHAERIPTLVNRKKGITEIEFGAEQTKEEIDPVKYPIDVVHFEGEAKFVGVYGLTGGFEGWFSNDAARVPILAKMKVLIGNVRIELMKWTRNGWIPPRYIKEKDR